MAGNSQKGIININLSIKTMKKKKFKKGDIIMFRPVGAEDLPYEQVKYLRGEGDGFIIFDYLDSDKHVKINPKLDSWISESLSEILPYNEVKFKESFRKWKEEELDFWLGNTKT